MIPVILSGGAGSRLWPVSRQRYPKPFIRLADGRSLVQRAFERALALKDAKEVVTVTNRDLLFTTEDEYRGVKAEGVGKTYLLEPEGRDTAGAIAVAALHIAESHGAGTPVCVFPADHMIGDVPAFVAAVDKAVALASTGRLVTFGIKPEHPEPGYGYIEADGERVLRFVEKPDRNTAADYVRSKRFYWNSGMFAFRAGDMIAAMRAHCADVLDAAEASLKASRRAAGPGYVQIELDAARFAAVPKISIDYAVFEKADDIAVVPCAIDWSDIGSWNAVAGLVTPDGGGNRVVGEAVMLDTADCYIESTNRLTATIGVRDLIVVDTADALLIAERSRAQDVKALFARLAKTGHPAHDLHRTVHRPWGAYTVLEEGPRFKIKRIEVKPGGRLSLQRHRHRSEHWVVVSGTARIVNGDKELVLVTDQSTYIPSGHLHRLENPGLVPLVLIEVQSGEYLGEDDIERIDDVYGRAAHD